jgi:hypothetical protein
MSTTGVQMNGRLNADTMLLKVQKWLTMTQ